MPLSFFDIVDSVMTRPQTVRLWQVAAARSHGPPLRIEAELQASGKARPRRYAPLAAPGGELREAAGVDAQAVIERRGPLGRFP